MLQNARVQGYDYASPYYGGGIHGFDYAGGGGVHAANVENMQQMMRWAAAHRAAQERPDRMAFRPMFDFNRPRPIDPGLPAIVPPPIPVPHYPGVGSEEIDMLRRALAMFLASTANNQPSKLVMFPATSITNGTTGTVTSTACASDVRIQRIVIEATGCYVTGIKVGNVDVNLNGGVFPVSAFGSTARVPPIEPIILPTGVACVISLQNPTGSPVTAICGAFGVDVGRQICG